jgi:mono/diheme cytochrome c family protein
MNRITKTSALLLAGLAITLGTQAAENAAGKPGTLPPASSKQGLTFDTDIKPMFEASCIRCHGEQRPKGGLRLNTRDNVLKGGEEGKIIVAGDSAKSKLVTSIARINPKTAMPPEPKAPRGPRPGASAGEGNKPAQAGPPPKPLTPEEVGIVRAWIDQGAK